MTAFKNGKAIGQVTEILIDSKLYQEEEIKKALKKLNEKENKI